MSDLETLYDVHLKMDAIAVIDRKMRSLAEQASDGRIVYDPERSRIRLRGLSDDEVFAYAQSLHDAVEFLEERWKAKHRNA